MKLQTKRLVDKWLGYFLVVLLVPLTRVLGMLLRKDHSLKKPSQTIIFIKLLGLGSLVQTSDMVIHIRKTNPDSRLVLLTDSNIAAGIEYFDLFNETWCIRNRSFIHTIMDSWKLLTKCWNLKGLWIVDLEVYSKLTTVYSLLTLGKNRFGFYLKPVFFRKFLNTHNIFFDQSGFIEDNYERMAVAVTGKAFERNVSETKLELFKPFVAINNTCSDLSIHRKLPDATLALVCRWILQNTHYSIALLGSPSDKNLNEYFIEQYLLPVQRTKNIAGSSFKQYYHFLETKTAFVITIDSAPLHIARKMGLPTISAWGPTAPSNYLKVEEEENKLHPFYYSKVYCSPCVHRIKNLPCKGDNFCMKDIPAEKIINKIEKLINLKKEIIEA